MKARVIRACFVAPLAMAIGLTAASGIAGASSSENSSSSTIVSQTPPEVSYTSAQLMTVPPPVVVMALPAPSAPNVAVAAPSATLTQTISVTLLPGS